MNHRRTTALCLAGLLLTGGQLFAAKITRAKKAPESDLASIESRRITVEMAQNLAKVETVSDLPDPLPQPFNPQGFNRVVHQEAHPAGDSSPAVRAVSGDREVLTAIAARVTPSGTFELGSNRWLQFSKKRLKVGDHLTVTHEGQDYNLELTAIDATNFTLRLNREEITRPIKPGKNP